MQNNFNITIFYPPLGTIVDSQFSFTSFIFFLSNRFFSLLAAASAILTLEFYVIV